MVWNNNVIWRLCRSADFVVECLKCPTSFQHCVSNLEIVRVSSAAFQYRCNVWPKKQKSLLSVTEEHLRISYYVYLHEHKLQPCWLDEIHSSLHPYDSWPLVILCSNAQNITCHVNSSVIWLLWCNSRFYLDTSILYTVIKLTIWRTIFLSQ